MAALFDQKGHYFANLGVDGKLRIWDVLSNSLEQEYTPDLHLKSPCTCLCFVQMDSSDTGSVRKRRKSDTGLTPYVALGTSAGLLLIYSIAKAELDCSIDSNTHLSLNCLSFSDSQVLYSGVQDYVLAWSLRDKIMERKWKSKNDQITAILCLPNNYLLTGSKSIKLWKADSAELLRVYTGHSSQVTLLELVILDNVDSEGREEVYFISASKTERTLSCWSLQEGINKNAVASFVVEDIAHTMSVWTNGEGVTSLAVGVRSGVVHIYNLKIKRSVAKPIRPKTTIQIVRDNSGNSDSTTEMIESLPICSFRPNLDKNKEQLVIVYGTVVYQFETITLDFNEKVLTLLRKDPKHTIQDASNQKQQGQKNKKSEKKRGDTIHYLTSFDKPRKAHKRANQGEISLEIPMEQRLENMKLTEADGFHDQTCAHLLIQGLHSRDRAILSAIFQKNFDEAVLEATIRRLPIQAITPLVEELTNLIKSKTQACQIGARWLKIVIQFHAGVLLANPEVANLLAPIVDAFEHRAKLQLHLNRLHGRLNLLEDQLRKQVFANKQEQSSLTHTPGVAWDSTCAVFDDTDLNMASTAWNIAPNSTIDGAPETQIDSDDNEDWLESDADANPVCNDTDEELNESSPVLVNGISADSEDNEENGDFDEEMSSMS